MSILTHSNFISMMRVVNQRPAIRHICARVLTGVKMRLMSSSGKYQPPPDENPISRTLRILKGDMMTLKKRIIPTPAQYVDDVVMKGVVPQHCDIVIIGGGVIGSSIAYWLKRKALRGLNIVVLEKEPTYAQASTVLSCGGLRHQFSLPENIQMSLFAAEFFRNINEYLGIEGPEGKGESVDLQFTPYGYLFLASEEGAEQLMKNSELQVELGAKNELLTSRQLKEKFPWLNVEGIALGCHGLEGEGWFDPWSLLQAFKKKAYNLGVNYITAEAVGFEFKNMPDFMIQGVEMGRYEALDRILIKTPDEEIHAIKFAIAIIAAGAQSGKVAEMTRVGSGKGLLSIPLPVEPRKRFVYCYHCHDGPGLNTPFTIDPSGTYFRREGLFGNYIGGCSPREDEEPPVETGLEDVDHSFFDTNVWPNLAKRVPAFENIKVKSAWAGFYDHNYFDENAIVGPHPYYHNLYLACGFSGHGLQQAPAIGRAVMEMIIDGQFMTIDLSRMGFDRIVVREPLLESNIV
ncbi:FAD-dependent oxidoreductase domain-containing protein 1-like [Ischnura elegans]|uniref:FAD-dependent oxidoreductase domain-containing protein 1-like n=1 Tax=Ischnura elegans TaxID=197161 RepID=UPI001ED88B5D|nr:FAD-dependent oxidoreductase domain-containing protein 1-like [Ischnura elegans]